MIIRMIDGISIECASFRAIDAGVLLFDESPEDDEDREAIGFVPYGELQYVLSEDLEEQIQAQTAPAPQQQQPPQGQPPRQSQPQGQGPGSQMPPGQ